MGRNRRYPVGLPALPYKCTDFSCGCHREAHDGYQQVRLHRERDVWIGYIFQASHQIDEFHDHDVMDLLGAIHRAYPFALFDPEQSA